MSQAKYSRAAPSPRYRRLLEQYQHMHLHGEEHLGIPPESTFPGKSLPKQAPSIKRLIKATGAQSILDYGCGKGQQYLPRRMADPDEGIEYPDIKSYWGVQSIQCYDPGYPPFMQLPSGKFDGVICTDVLEHCPEEDVPWILAELFSYATKFVFANAATFPAHKRLPSGGNAHCTIRPPRWWEDQFARAARTRPALSYELRITFLNKENQQQDKTVASSAVGTTQ
jgi:SAM-dependent methyltransferase